jgi:YD repeat-containing protein
MKRLSLPLLLLAVIFFSNGCDEEDDDPTTITTEYDLVKTRTVYGATTTYTYDAQGRVIREDYESGGYAVIAFTSGQATYTTYDPLGVVEEIFEYQLNNEGYIVSGPGVAWTYNSDGRILTTTYTNSSDTNLTTNEYTNGNLIRSSVNGSTTQYTTYTYLTDKVETRMTGSRTLYGNPSYNLLSSFTNHDGANPSATYTYTYAYDSKGRVITQTQSDNGGGIFDVQSYTYFD